MNTIGENIRKYRKQKHMTQRELANTLGMRDAAISKYEKGIVSPSLDVLKKIAAALNVDVIEILYEPTKNISEMSQNEIKELMNKMKNVSEEFEKSVQNLNKAYSESSEYIVDYYNMLNKKGKIEATKRTAELTKIEEYTKPDTE